MKASVCPFCGLESGVPHHTQRGCIDALQEEIARTREVLGHRTEPLLAATHLRPHHLSAPSEAYVHNAPRLSLRCVIES